MNGDRYPDSVAGGGIMYGDGAGNFSAPVSPDPTSSNGIGDLRDIEKSQMSAPESRGRPNPE